MVIKRDRPCVIAEHDISVFYKIPVPVEFIRILDCPKGKKSSYFSASICHMPLIANRRPDQQNQFRPGLYNLVFQPTIIENIDIFIANYSFHSFCHICH